VPIENERKFVLRNDIELEKRLAQAPGVSRSLILQAYLDAPGLRVRAIEVAGQMRHIFSYKRPVEGQVVEIETDLEPEDFRRLWKTKRESLQKVRYSWPDGRYRWDIDFFKRPNGHTYFVLAEVEMPEHQEIPPPVPASLASYLIGLAPNGDPRFTSKRLADPAHAEALLREIVERGSIT
jgi:CYTH domain-containing protein